MMAKKPIASSRVSLSTAFSVVRALLINSGEQTARARQYRQQSDAQQYSCSTAGNLLRRINEPGVAIWKERLHKLKRNGAAKNHKANSAWTSRVTEIKQETEQAKRADVFKHNHKPGSVSVSSGLRE